MSYSHPVEFLGIIPARKGSKGIKNKNTKSLVGMPLISYTIQAAQKSKLLKDFIVSTDSKYIAGVAKRFGANVPFLRPTSLAQDQTPTLPVLQHALQSYEKISKKEFSHIIVLQPTTPLRLAKDIDLAIKMIKKQRKKDSLITCYEGKSIHPRIMYIQKKDKVFPFLSAKKEILPRQKFEQTYVRNGAIYIVAKDLLMKHHQLIGQDPLMMLMPRWRSINIDDLEDFKFAEMLIKHYGKD